MVNGLFDIIDDLSMVKSQRQVINQCWFTDTARTQQMFTAHKTKTTRLNCLFRNTTQHSTTACDQYKTTIERKRRLQSLRICFRCLKAYSAGHQCNHSCYNCNSLSNIMRTAKKDCFYS